MITKKILELRDLFVKENKLSSYSMINAGPCESFADIVYVSVINQIDTLKIISIDDFKTFEHDGHYIESFDEEALARYGEDELPLGITTCQLDELQLGHHVWLYNDGLHYDSESPEGEESFFDLNIYKNFFALLKKYLKGKELLDSNNKINTRSISAVSGFNAWYIDLFDTMFREKIEKLGTKYNHAEDVEEFFLRVL